MAVAEAIERFSPRKVSSASAHFARALVADAAPESVNRAKCSYVKQESRVASISPGHCLHPASPAKRRWVAFRVVPRAIPSAERSWAACRGGAAASWRAPSARAQTSRAMTTSTRVDASGRWRWTVHLSTAERRRSQSEHGATCPKRTTARCFQPGAVGARAFARARGKTCFDALAQASTPAPPASSLSAQAAGARLAGTTPWLRVPETRDL